jgi:hypothetical protein
MPVRGVERLAKSLETKWGSIKHNASKFISMYGFVVALNVNGSLADDTLQRACSNTRSKIQKVKVFFSFIVG